MKKIILAGLVLCLSACSSVGKLTENRVENEKSVTAEFMGGDIVVTYTKDGKFESITSAGTARVTSNLPSANEEAFIVATLRARKQLSEFMRTDLESDKFVSTVYNSLQEGEKTENFTDNNVKSKIAYDVQENIKQKSSAILKGTFIESKKFDKQTSTVRVVVKTGVNDVGASKALSSLMGN